MLAAVIWGAKNFLKKSGNGKANTAALLLINLNALAHPATGRAMPLPWPARPVIRA